MIIGYDNDDDDNDNDDDNGDDNNDIQSNNETSNLKRYFRTLTQTAFTVNIHNNLKVCYIRLSIQTAIIIIMANIRKFGLCSRSIISQVA